MLFLRFLFFSVSIFTIGAIAWLFSGYSLDEVAYKKLQTAAPNLIVSNIGTKAKNGNILGIQSYMIPADYSSELRFYNKLDQYFSEALDKGFLQGESTIVVFPEHIGTPLFLLDENKKAITANSLKDAIHSIIINHPSAFVLEYWKTKSKDRILETVLNLKSKSMYNTYTNTFSKLSKNYKTTIIAGSIVVPKFLITNQKEDTNKFINLSLTFSSKGEIIKRVVKNNLANYEKVLNASGESIDHPLPSKYDIILSHDSIYKKSYQKIDPALEYVISPSCIIDYSDIDWKSTDIVEIIPPNPYMPPPPVEKINLPEADDQLESQKLWLLNSLRKKLKNTNVKVGVQVFLKGKLFESKLRGYSNVIIKNGKHEILISDNQPGLINIWL